ncbi:MAG: T9SS type A sorting domain-containing protein [Bacteroidales bacterium]|nr:T9SS type A sorting domain-containing protein [Bacteroidales bacterium]
MKTKILLSFLALTLGFFVSAFGQKPTMELTFTAEYNGQYVPLDSIFIENLTQGGDTTLYAPDTILSLEYNTGIEDINLSKNIFSLSQNYPNPFKEKTTVNLYLQEKEHIKITIRDIIGRKVAQYENTLNQGNHSFKFYSGNEKFYLLTVTGKYASKTIKMLNANDNITYKGKCKIVYNKNVDNVIGFKSQNINNNFVFNLGDELRYIGYAKTVNEVNGSNVIENTPQTNEIYKFEITEGIPCPGIPFVVYEGQVYNTVLIGDQCWFKENLNVGSMLSDLHPMQNNRIIEKFCYDNDESNCDEYGALYQWDEMMQYSLLEEAQGICPDGWHIPSDDEWCILTNFIDSTVSCSGTEWIGTNVGYKMKSTSNWYALGYGSDSLGFRALPAGQGCWIYLYKTRDAYFWSSSDSYDYPKYFRFNNYSDKVYYWGTIKDFAFSVRCIKD